MRLYRTPRFRSDRPENLYLVVPEEVLTSTVLLGERSHDGDRVIGSAFFISTAGLNDRSTRHVYLVTARHCVEHRRGLFIRHSGHGDSGITDFAIDEDARWWTWDDLKSPETSESQSVDLAITYWPHWDETMSTVHGSLPDTMLFDEILFTNHSDQGVGIGDEVVSVGLMSVRSSTNRTEPVITTGRLAMVPRFPIAPIGQPGFPRMRLYLVELRSTWGAIGSPVIVRHRNAVGVPMPQVSLLGVLIGFWCEDERHFDTGIVLPAELLKDLLKSEGPVEERRAFEVARELS